MSDTRVETLNCYLCGELMEITLSQEATLESIKDIKKVHNHCAGGMNEDGTLKSIGDWMEEIRAYKEKILSSSVYDTGEEE